MLSDLKRYERPLIVMTIRLEHFRDLPAMDAPHPIIYALARKALEREPQADNTPWILELARELRPRLVAFADAVGTGPGGALSLAGGTAWDTREPARDTRDRVNLALDGEDDPEGPSLLLASIEKPLGQETDLCAAAGTDALDGDLLDLDRRAAEYLASLGPKGREQADLILTRAKSTWATWKDYKARHPDAPTWLEALQRDPDNCPDLLEYWRDTLAGELVGDLAPILNAVARVVWLDLVKPRLVAAEKGLSVRSVFDGKGDQWVQVAKPLAGISWAIGGQGLVLDSGLVLDGDSYGEAPAGRGRAVYLPRSWELLPDKVKERPAQQVFPLTDPEPVTLAVAALTVDRELLPPVAAKAAVLALASGGFGCTLGDLTRALQPGKARYQARDFELTHDALLALDSLHIMLPQEGQYFRAFEVVKLTDPTPDKAVAVATGRFFSEILVKDGRFNGAFLINMTRFLALDNRNPRLQRYYLRAAAAWNDARHCKTAAFAPEQLELVDLQTFAARSNALTPSAIEYLKRNRKGTDANRKHASRDLSAVKTDLEQLAAQGLLVLEKAGRKAWRLLPPEALLEAWQNFRDNRAGLHTLR